MSQQYFARILFHSPHSSDYGSDTHSDSDSDSDSTLEDVEVAASFGYPLQRMYSSESASSTTSSLNYDIDFEALVDNFLAMNPKFTVSGKRGMVMVEPSSASSNDSIMMKCLPRTSTELYLLLELNHPDLRNDPWNPAPHIICAVERDERIFLCMGRLVEYNQPPFKTVANYIDFFRQILEGLTFLHELSIAQLTCWDPASYMVDLSSAPGTCPHLVDHFDRTAYPVRYYFTDLACASKFDSAATPVTGSASTSPFRQDVHDCGMMIDRLLVMIPCVSPKLKSLINAMTTGGFGADDARKLFDALCKSLESSVFDSTVSKEYHTDLPFDNGLSLPHDLLRDIS